MYPIFHSQKNVLATLTEDKCDLAILPFEVSSATFAQIKYVEEHLSITVKKDHPLSLKSEVTFSDLNGYNFLLRSDIGFWEQFYPTIELLFLLRIRKLMLPTILAQTIGKSLKQSLPDNTPDFFTAF